MFWLLGLFLSLWMFLVVLVVLCASCVLAAFDDLLVLDVLAVWVVFADLYGLPALVVFSSSDAFYIVLAAL